jgi:hypothetical protein
MNPELPENFLHIMLPVLTLSGQLAPDKHKKILDILDKGGGLQPALDMLMQILMTQELKLKARLNYPDTGNHNRMNEY